MLELKVFQVNTFFGPNSRSFSAEDQGAALVRNKVLKQIFEGKGVDYEYISFLGPNEIVSEAKKHSLRKKRIMLTGYCREIEDTSGLVEVSMNYLNEVYANTILEISQIAPFVVFSDLPHHTIEEGKRTYPHMKDAYFVSRKVMTEGKDIDLVGRYLLKSLGIR